MFIRPSSILLPVVAFAAVATAAPSALEARDQCNTGSISCCNSTYSVSPTDCGLLSLTVSRPSQSTSATITSLAGLLGIVLPAVQGLVGLGCSPITGLGTGSGAVCTQQPVCCTDNTYNGLINLGCSPINLNL
ncbi:fungal hydrophobin [Gyrodon lividus]|nr:fungal hydrophobin [Gyrodon lividus]